MALTDLQMALRLFEKKMLSQVRKEGEGGGGGGAIRREEERGNEHTTSTVRMCTSDGLPMTGCVSRAHPRHDEPIMYIPGTVIVRSVINTPRH